LDKPDDALKAAFTYYIYHLDDKVAKTNVEYYLGTTGEKVESVVNRESHVIKKTNLQFLGIIFKYYT
jgi:hypothetical protein